MGLLLEGNPLGRNVLFKKAGEMAQKQARGNYPAIPKILDVVKTGLESGVSAGLKAEHEVWRPCSYSREQGAAVNFFGGTALKKNKFGAPKRRVETLGVLGAGLMGAGVAQVSAAKGYKVLLKDVNNAFLGKGEKQIAGDFNKKVKKRRMTPHERDLILSKIVPLSDEAGNGSPTLQTAISSLRQSPRRSDSSIASFRSSKRCSPSTPSSPPTRLRSPSAISLRAANVPQNVIGMHYFSPVPMMPLLEVITHEGTDPDVVSAAVSVGLKQGKTVIVVKDVPGFYVNRSLGPYMVEVMALLQAGVSVDKLEKAMLSYGFPVGPITLLDEVGHDVAMHVQETLQGDLGIRAKGQHGSSRRSCRQRHPGPQERQGFYLYPPQKGKKKAKRQSNPEVANILKKYELADKPELSDEDIQNRMSCRFVNEAAMCLQDGIIDNPCRRRHRCRVRHRIPSLSRRAL